MKYNKRKKLCLIYNFAQHYRSNIFQLMDQELHCDFVFGDSYLDVKKMDYSLLANVQEVRNRRVIGNWYIQLNVISLLAKYKVLFIVGDVHCISTWIILFFARFWNTRIYIWGHGWYGKESFFVSQLKKLYFMLAHGVFLYGTYARELMIKRGFQKDKLYVIYNSLDYDRQIEIRKTLYPSDIFHAHFQNSAPNLIFVGRLTQIKRLDMLLDSLRILHDEDVKVNLTFVGDGEQCQVLEKRAYDLGIKDYVWFYGACYDEQKLSELIYNADLCVSPGNVGLTAMHSMVFGTPVITHDNFAYQMPEFEAVQKGETGDFFRYGDVVSLADTIKNWIVIKQKCRTDIRQNCYDVIDNKYNPHCQIRIMKQHLE